MNTTPDDAIPAAFAVAMASYPGQPLARCSCGCLKPAGAPCPNAPRDAIRCPR